MKYKISDNWADTAGMMSKKPVVILPFVFIAFFELLALEVLYFSTRKPLSAFAGPIIKKFFGESSLHYPGDIFATLRIFYYADMAIYAILSVALISISINIFYNLRSGLPVRADAMIKNASKRYFSFVSFGILMAALITLVNKADMFVVQKIIHRLSRILPQDVGANILLFFLSSVAVFVSNLILQSIMISVIPIMVLKKKNVIAAIMNNFSIVLRRYFTLLRVIFLPFLAYLPIIIIRSGSMQVADKTFPEMTLVIMAVSVIVAAVIDCFIFLAVSRFILDLEPKVEER